MRTSSRPYLFLGLLAGLFIAVGTAGCAVHAARPAVVVQPSPVVVSRPAVVYTTAPPARVYYGGRWLVYRDHAYYYYHSGSWFVASSVPVHVARYHRPHTTHVRRSSSHTPSRRYRSPDRSSRPRTHRRYYRRHRKMLEQKGDWIPMS